MAETTPTPFSWPSGPETVQVSGDWDGWKDKVGLDKQSDGSFSGKIPLPSNTKVHYKYIVDGNWTTSPNEQVVDDAGNQNNVVDVGPAPTVTEAVTAKAGEIGAGVVAGVTGAAAAATAAAHQFTDHVNGTTETSDQTQPAKTLTEEEKKDAPAAAIKETADGDIRNNVPASVTSATHAALPVLASAVATVTGADIMRGNPESLPVSQKEINDTQAEAMKGDNTFLASRIEPQGGAVSDPKAAVTENAKAASSVANAATTGAPVVPVTDNGFAANVTAQSGGLTTAADANKEGGEKAGAIATASAGAGIGAAAAAVNGTKTTQKPVESEKVAAPSSEPLAKAAPAASEKKLPTVGPASSKVEADKATAPAAASSGPLAKGKETTTPAAAPTTDQGKSLPVTPKKVAPTSGKGDTIKEKGATASGVAGVKSQHSAHASSATKASEASSSPSTPDRKKKTGLFGKIKHALSPSSSPSK